MNIAIIPARGGSKRIPKKNIYPLLGTPVIGYSIRAALESGCFSGVYVATDSSEIAEVAREYGASVPFLRSSYNDSESPVSLATIDYVKQLVRSGIIEKPINVAQIFAVCPLLQADDIITSMNSYMVNSRVFQISCAAFMSGNPWWAFRMMEDNRAEWLCEEYRHMRSQDLPAAYFPTGAIWIAKWDSLVESNTFYGEPLAFEVLSQACGIDIDWPEDLELAEVMLSVRMRNNGKA